MLHQWVLTAWLEDSSSYISIVLFYVFGPTAPKWARASSFTRFLDHTQRRTTVVMAPLDEWSARRRDIYMTTHNSHNRTDIHAPGWLRIHNLNRQAAADLRLRRRGRWGRHLSIVVIRNQCRTGRMKNFISYPPVCTEISLHLKVQTDPAVKTAPSGLIAQR